MNDGFSGSKCIFKAIYSRNKLVKCIHWVIEGRTETRQFFKISAFKLFQIPDILLPSPEVVFWKSVFFLLYTFLV